MDCFVASLLAMTREEGSHHMASIHKDIPIDASPDEVWAAVRDFGSPHQRLVPGFVLDARLDGHPRIVSFANRTLAPRLLVHSDPAPPPPLPPLITHRLPH